MYEKESTAGGQYRLAAMPPMKQELARTITTYLTFCRNYGVNICYGTKADRSLLEKGNFDEIILACGATSASSQHSWHWRSPCVSGQ